MNLTELMQNTANAIRTKKGTTGTINAQNFPQEILTIESGSTSSDDFYNLRTNNGTSGQGLFAYLPLVVQRKTEMISFIENLDTSNMIGFESMLTGNSNLIELDLSAWNTINVINVYQMFSGCSNLTTLNLSNWNTIKLKTLSYMLNGCSKLELLDLTGWNTINTTTFYYMFPCVRLVEIKGVIDLQSAQNITNMFGNNTSTACKLLETVNIKNLNITGLNLIYCTALSHESLMYLINNLVSTETSKTINLGATNLSKLTDEEKAIAVEAGWTLA